MWDRLKDRLISRKVFIFFVYLGVMVIMALLKTEGVAELASGAAYGLPLVLLGQSAVDVAERWRNPPPAPPA